MRTYVGVCSMLAVTALLLPGLADDKGKPVSRPPTEADRKAQDLDTRIIAHLQQAQFQAAEPFAEEHLAVVRLRRGPDHGETQDAQRRLDLIRLLRGKPADDQQAIARIYRERPEAKNARDQQRFAEAEKLARAHLDVCVKILGAQHAETAQCYDDLSHALYLQRNSAEAEPLALKALDIRLRVLGERHVRTGWSAQSMASILYQLRKYEDARQHFQKAADIYRQAVGEDDALMVTCYQLLGGTLRQQRKFVEAMEMYQKALAINLRTQGKEHADTVTCYQGIADNLNLQGRYGQAQPFYEKALELKRKLLGDKHADLVRGYHDVAYNLQQMGRFADAIPYAQQGVETAIQVHGASHEQTATEYSTLAVIYQGLGRFAEAQALFERALDIDVRALGEETTDVSTDYHNLAATLQAQRRYAEAEPLLRKALEIRRRVLTQPDGHMAIFHNTLGINFAEQGHHDQALTHFQTAFDLSRQLFGESHPNTINGLNSLGAVLDELGKYAEAQEHLAKALSAWRKQLGDEAPQTALAMHNLAYCFKLQGQHVEAGGLFRKALELRVHLLGRHHPNTVATAKALGLNLYEQGKYEAAEQAWLEAAQSFDLARLAVSSQGLERAVYGARYSPFPWLAACQARLGKPLAAWLHLEQHLARGLLDEASARLARTRTPEEQAQQLRVRSELQQVAQQVTALVAQKDKLPAGKAKLDELTKQRESLQAELARIDADWSRREVLPLDRIQKQLPPDAALVCWTGLPGSPKAANPDGESWACIVRPRGLPIWCSIPAATHGDSRGISHDPVVQKVLHAVSRADAGTDANQLLRALAAQRLDPLEPHLRATAELPAVRQLLVVPAGPMAGIPVDALTDRYLVSFVPSATFYARQREARAPMPTAAPGRLLALADPVFQRALSPGPRPIAPEPIVRGPAFTSLPGTRSEVQAIATLFAESDVLLGSDASEQRLQALAGSGQLTQYRYIHLATHGVIDDQLPRQSALILAQDQLPDPAEQARLGRKPVTGRLTVEQVLQTWKLQAELVTLSACRSGLGRQGGGDGYVGFSQALMLAGARSIVVSLWQVDDTATSLLMARFYQNLLGKRPGLDRPLPKAEALREAKLWLRNLSRIEAGEVIAKLPEAARGLKLEGAAAGEKTAKRDEKPFAHPFYWSAFILMGDPS